MIKYKRIVLSLAAVATLSASSLSADYLPLTTPDKDNQWVILGVSGLKTDGAVAGIAGEFSIVVDGTNNSLTDSSNDVTEESGMDTGTGDLVQLKVLVTAPVEIRIDTKDSAGDLILNATTDPVRTMYVAVSEDDVTASFAVSFKSILEGKTLEYAVAGGKTYETKLDSQYVFNNPAVGVETTGGDDVNGTQLSSLTATNSLVDYDFADNPTAFTSWDGAAHSTAKGAADLRVYSYDALGAKWKIFDTRNNEDANDFTDLIAGKGYWAKLDVGGDATSNADGEAGLILGTPNLDATDYVNAGLSEGWNFISFDGKSAGIRDVAVGMIVTTDTQAAVASAFSITDSSGNHTINIPADAADDASNVVAKNINYAIFKAKLDGDLPSNFELRAFTTDTVNQLIIVANKKFTLKNVVAGTLLGATSLNGADLLNPADLAGALINVVGATGVTSVYGEHAMVVEPLVGAGTAQNLTNNPASVQIIDASDDASATYGIAAYGAAGTVASAATALGNTADVNTINIDLDNTAGAADAKYVLMTSASPFTLRDHTFTRTFKYTSIGGANDSVLNVDGSADITISDSSDANTEAGVIDPTGVYSAGDDATNIYIVTDEPAKAKFVVTETVNDLLQRVTGGTDLAKGAVKNVFSLGYLARVTNRNEIKIDIDLFPDAATDAFEIAVTDPVSTVTSAIVVPGVQTDAKTLLDLYAAALNTVLDANIMDANARAVIGENLDDSYILVYGPDITAAAQAQTTQAGLVTEGATAGVVDSSYLATYTDKGDLAKDLKYNMLKSPDYVMDGPLYTIRKSNMTLEALVTGRTDLSDGSVAWESIDLTRKPSEWLNSQDYDLFEVDSTSGYWAYLTAYTGGNDLAVSDPKLSRDSTIHYFDYDTTTSTHNSINEFSGNLELYVAGLNSYDAYRSVRVTATIGTATFELTQDATDKTKFSGYVSTNEAYGMALNANHDIEINIADGLGNSYYTEIADVFDNQKPDAPTVEFVGGQLTIGSNDPLVKGFYVFNGLPTELDPETNKRAFTAEGGALSVLCDAGTPASAAADVPGTGITVIAVDGTGKLAAGNASDAKGVAFMPILKDRVYVSNTHNGAAPDSSTGGNSFDGTCVDTGPLLIDTKVTLTAITPDTVVELAYAPLGIGSTEAPITAYVADQAGANGNIAAITYPSAYVGTDIFVMLGGKMYSYTLLDDATLDDADNSAVLPADISASLKADITF